MTDMNNKTIAVLVAILLGCGVTGWFFLTRYNQPDELPGTDVISIPQQLPKTPVEDNTHFPDMEFDEPFEETRIILADPNDDELRDLLSDKVIRDDKIVDKIQQANN